MVDSCLELLCRMRVFGKLMSVIYKTLLGFLFCKLWSNSFSFFDFPRSNIYILNHVTLWLSAEIFGREGILSNLRLSCRTLLEMK